MASRPTSPLHPPHPSDIGMMTGHSFHSRAGWWSRLSRRGGHALGFVLLLGAVAHLAVLSIVGLPTAATRTMMVAENLADGRGFSFCNAYFPFCGEGNQVTASVEPVPVLAYAALTKLLGAISLQVIIGLQLATRLATVLIVYAIAMQVFGQRRTALLAALLTATYYPVIRISLLPINEPLFMLFLALGVLFFLKGMARPAPSKWALAGLLFGLAAMSRSAFVNFPFLLILIVVPLMAGSSVRRIASSAALLLVFSLTLSPWVIRNAFAFDAFIPGGTLTGYNLYRHNHIIEQDNYLRYVATEEAARAVDDLVRRRTDLRGDESEHEMDGVFLHEAISIIAGHPLRYLSLSLYRFVPLWFDVAITTGSVSLSGLVVAIENAVLLLLACLTVLRRRHTRHLGMLAIIALVVYFTGGHMMVVAKLRYVVPISPFLIILAADQACYFLRRAQRAVLSPRRSEQLLDERAAAFRRSNSGHLAVLPRRALAASLADIAPTIPALKRLPIGKDMDGKDMDALGDPGRLGLHPLSSVESWDTP